MGLWRRSMSRVSTNYRDSGVPFISGTANRNFMTEKDLVGSSKPVGRDANKSTKQMNLFSAINQALHTALESDPRSFTFVPFYFECCIIRWMLWRSLWVLLISFLEKFCTYDISNWYEELWFWAPAQGSCTMISSSDSFFSSRNYTKDWGREERGCNIEFWWEFWALSTLQFGAQSALSTNSSSDSICSSRNYIKQLRERERLHLQV